MTQIERQIITTYRWWRDGEIDPEHVTDLEEHAMERITDMRKEGYTSGELSCNIDDVEYTGWWEMTTKNINSEWS